MRKLAIAMLVALGLPAITQAQEFTVADIIVDGYQRISGIIYNLLPMVSVM